MASASDSHSSSHGFEFFSGHYLDLFHSSPRFKTSATLANSQLQDKTRRDNFITFGLPLASWESEQFYVQYELFVSVVCSVLLALML